jgi:hypothetical protein
LIEDMLFGSLELSAGPECLNRRGERKRRT